MTALLFESLHSVSLSILLTVNFMWVQLLTVNNCMWVLLLTVLLFAFQCMWVTVNCMWVTVDCMCGLLLTASYM